MGEPIDPRVLDAAQLREVLDDWKEGMQILSPEWRYLYINETAAQHGRRSRGELLGKTLVECYPGVEQTPMFAALQHCMRERVSATFENDFEYPDGSRGAFELHVQPCPEGLIVLSLSRANAQAPRADR
jgi:hypothetical protein